MAVNRIVAESTFNFQGADFPLIALDSQELVIPSFDVLVAFGFYTDCEDMDMVANNIPPFMLPVAKAMTEDDIKFFSQDYSRLLVDVYGELTPGILLHLIIRCCAIWWKAENMELLTKVTDKYKAFLCKSWLYFFLRETGK